MTKAQEKRVMERINRLKQYVQEETSKRQSGFLDGFEEAIDQVLAIVKEEKERIS